MLDEWPVVATGYEEEIYMKEKWLSTSIQISPRENYLLSIEILRAGLSEIYQLNIRMNKEAIGFCNPTGHSDSDCHFMFK